MSTVALLISFLTLGANCLAIERAEPSFTPPTPQSISRLPLVCPTSGQVTAWDKSVFSCTNNTNLISGDVTGIIAYSVADCADACATANNFINGGCDAFTHDADLARSYSINNGANCWLKRQSDTEGSSVDYNGVSGRSVSRK